MSQHIIFVRNNKNASFPITSTLFSTMNVCLANVAVSLYSGGGVEMDFFNFSVRFYRVANIKFGYTKERIENSDCIKGSPF